VDTTWRARSQSVAVMSRRANRDDLPRDNAG
jgi:hypothetical protein